MKDGATLASSDVASYRSVTHHTTIYIKMHRHTDDPWSWAYNSHFPDVEIEKFRPLPKNTLLIGDRLGSNFLPMPLRITGLGPRWLSSQENLLFWSITRVHFPVHTL